ncbi:MAG: 3-oxoacyl-ACP synthase III family protein [Thermodesulfobacteriota bacterium]
MRPDDDVRLLGFGCHLPGGAVGNDALAPALGTTADELARATGIRLRHHAAEGQGPSDLALRAAGDALAAAATDVADLGLIVFATATPDVTFPGAACFLQDKLGAPTVGALDVRAQSAGFLCALDLALAFARLPAAGGGVDGRYARVLIAAGEVLSAGLDFSPRGRDMTARLADGAGAAVVGTGSRGPRVRALRWYTDGTLAERFWCEYPASRQYPVRITAQNLAEGRHFPTADLRALSPIVEQRLAEAAREVLDESGWQASELDLAIVDYVAPETARAAARVLAVPDARTVVPTGEFGHVMAGGLLMALARAAGELRPGARVLLAAAGPGLAWGAATLEL